MAPLELHIDLRERIFEAVSQTHQAVVHATKPSKQRDGDHQEPEQPTHSNLPRTSKRCFQCKGRPL